MISGRKLEHRVLGALIGLSTVAVFGVVHATGRDVVANVGEYELRVDEVQARVAQMPLFQLKNVGATPEEIRRKLVEEFVDLEVMVQGAKLNELHELPDVSERISSVLVSALLNDLSEEATTAGTVSDAAVRAFYEANKERYTPQQRIMIWQIAVESKEEADRLLDTIRSGSEFKDEASFVNAWDQLARAHSVDKSTNMRKGNLGFVQPDGATAHKDIRVPKEIFAAAAKIKDGEVHPEAVEVGAYWVIVARRGSHMTPLRTLESEAPNIRGFLAREQVAERRKALIDSLRAAHLHEKNERALDQLTFSNNEITVARRPGALRETQAPTGAVIPVGKPGNLR